MVDIYNCDEGRIRQRMAPTRRGDSGAELEVPFSTGEGCHKATSVTPRCGSVMVSLKKLSGYAIGSVRAVRRLYAGKSSSVRDASSTLGGSGRRANSCAIEGVSVGRMTGVFTLEPLAGVTALDDRGLFLDLGREGAWRKSSGMSFQLSMVATGVVVEGMRDGAEVAFGGGGGLFLATFSGG